MAFIIKSSKREYTPAPEGMHAAVCCDVIDMGEKETSFGPKHKVGLRFLLEENDETGKPFQVTRQFNVSMNEKSALRLALEMWRNRKFTKEELDEFDLDSVLGGNCQVVIAHNMSTDGTVYGNITAILPAQKNAVKLRVNGDYIKMRDREQKPQPAAKGDNGFGAAEYQATDSDMPF